jgi:hypothetical protein
MLYNYFVHHYYGAKFKVWEGNFQIAIQHWTVSAQFRGQLPDVCVPPQKISALKPNDQCDGIEKCELWKWLGHESRSYMIGLLPLPRGYILWFHLWTRLNLLWLWSLTSQALDMWKINVSCLLNTHLFIVIAALMD